MLPDATPVPRYKFVVPSNNTAVSSAGYSALLTTNYHWRARACDQTGRCSAWVSFGGNAENATDFHVP